MNRAIIAVCILMVLLSGCDGKLPDLGLPTQVTGGDPKTLEAATAAAQERADRYSSADYAGAWQLSSQEMHDAVNEADYVTYSETCTKTNSMNRMAITVTGVRMDGTDQAIVRWELLIVKQSVTMVYEAGKWVEAPSDFWIQNAGKPIQQIIAEQTAAGKCGDKPSPPTAPTTTSSAPYTPRPALTGDPASNIDYLLLTVEEVRSIVGGSSDLQLDGTMGAGPSDNSALVEPPTCVGVIFTAEQSVYGGTDFVALRDKTLRDSSSTFVQQTVVVYPTPEQAQALLTSSETKWRECASGEVSYSVPGTNGEVGWGFNFGSVELLDDVLTVSMAGINRSSGHSACQQAMGIRANVVVGVRSCNGDVDIPIDVTVADPNLAGTDAQRLAVAILDQIS